MSEEPVVSARGEGLALAFVAGCALLLWALLGGFLFWASTYRCGRGMCGLALVWPALLLGGATFIASVAVGLFAVSAAWTRGDRVAAAGLGLVAAIGLFAAYALYFNGHPGHPVVTAVYGFSPGEFGPRHPFGFPASVALVALMPVSALLYGIAGVAPAWLRRIAALACVLTAVGLLVAIRVTT